MSIYKKYMDSVFTDRSLESQSDAVRKAARAERSKRRKMCAAGVTAAAVMMCSVTAAASDRNILEMAAEWLGIGSQKAESSMAQVRCNESYNEIEGVEFVPRSVYSDGVVNIFFIDLIRTDGGIFDCSKFDVYMTDGTPAIDPETGEQMTDKHRIRFDHISATSHGIDHETGEEIPFVIIPCRPYIMEDDNPTDNMVTVAVYAEKEKGLLENGEATICLLLGGIKNQKHSMRQDAKGHYWIESETVEAMVGCWNGNLYYTPAECEKITLNPGNVSVFKTYPQNVDENGVMPMYDTPFTVDEISVSEMTVSLKIHGERPDEMRFFDEFCVGEIFLSDGSSILLNPDISTPSILKGGEHLPAISPADTPWECSLSVMLPETVDLDDVTAVRMGSEVYDIK